MSKTPRRRRRATTAGNADQTRKAFIAAAGKVFSEHAYDQAGLREIAALAGADKRLITRYFGSKEGLFAAALRAVNSKFEGMANGTSDMAARSAERTFGVSDLTEADRLGFISLCLHAATSRSGKRLVRADVKQQIDQVASRLTGPDAALRATLILVVCFGTALVREALKIDHLVNMSVDKAKTYWAPLLQQLVDGFAPAERAVAARSVSRGSVARNLSLPSTESRS